MRLFYTISLFLMLFSCKTANKVGSKSKPAVIQPAVIQRKASDSIFVCELTVQLPLDGLPQNDNFDMRLLQWSISQQADRPTYSLFYETAWKQCLAGKIKDYTDTIRTHEQIRDSLEAIQNAAEGEYVEIIRHHHQEGANPANYPLCSINERLTYDPMTHTISTEILSVTPISIINKPFYTIDFSQKPQKIPVSTKDPSLSFVKEFKIKADIQDLKPLHGSVQDWWADLLAFSQHDTTKVTHFSAPYFSSPYFSAPYFPVRFTKQELAEMWEHDDSTTSYDPETYEAKEVKIGHYMLKFSDCKKFALLQTFYFKADTFELACKTNFIAPAALDKQNRFWNYLYWISVE